MKRTNWNHISLCLALTLGLFLVLFGYVFANVQADTISQNATLWLRASDLPDHTQFAGLSRHAAVVYEDFVYVIGGAGTNLGLQSKDVYAGKIEHGGSISQWPKNSVLTKNLIYAPAAVAENGCIYLAGGRSGNTAQSSVIFGQAGDGSQISWKEENIPGFRARYLHALVISGDKMFALGGFKRGLPSPMGDVDYLNLSDDCTSPTNTWMSATSLNPTRTAHAAVAFEERVYVIGGFEGGLSSSDISSSVHSATIQTNGLSQWTELTCTLPISLAYHTAFISEAERCIYVVGGLTPEGDLSDKVYSAYIDDNGQLIGDPQNPTKWQEESALELSMSLYRHATVLAENGSVYVIGGQTKDQNGDDNNQSQVYYIPPLTLTKSNDPSGPVHEGDVITYTISYGNTGLITQTGVVITDRIPSNTELVPGSISPDYGAVENGVISWTIGTLAVSETGVASFQVRVPLLPSLSQSVDMLSSMEAYPPAQVLPVPIACDTTRFWANGVTRQPPEPKPHTIQVQIPSGTNPSAMWLLMKETDNISPTVEGQPAQLVRTSSNSFGASLWTAPITSAMVASGEVTVVTHNPRQLNALFLFDKEDPPFDEAALDDFVETTRTFTYTLEMPSVATQTMDVILPFMDITYWTDALLPDTRMTTVTVQFDGQSHTVAANDPNLGNGLLMTQFPFTIGPFTDTVTSTKVLTVTVDTEDSVYTLGPRVCRPVYIKNTAWLCSDQVGCISATATNIPKGFKLPGGIYLPIILKSHP